MREKRERLMCLLLACILVLQNIPIEIYAEEIKKKINRNAYAGITTTLTPMQGQTLELADDGSTIMMSNEEVITFDLSITPENIFDGEIGKIQTTIEVPQIVKSSTGGYTVEYGRSKDDPEVVGGLELDIIGGDDWKEANRLDVRQKVVLTRSAGLSAGVTSTIKVQAKLWVKENETLPEQMRLELKATSYTGSYTDISGNVYPLDFTESLHANARQVIINSNLLFTATIEAVEKEEKDKVLWDKYNYLEMQVTVENTSKVSGPYFDEHELFLTLPHEMNDVPIGIRDKDISKWAYNMETGEVIERTPEEVAANPRGTFIGKEGEGGILIYDVTEYNLTLKDELPKELTDVDCIPYSNLGAGQISIKRSQSEENRVESPLTQGGENTKRVYRIKIPFPNKTLGESPYRVDIGLAYTVGFGDPIVRLTRKTEGVGNFVQGKKGGTLTKEVNTETASNGYIGKESSYKIKEIGNTGTYRILNPSVIDRLPEGFKLKRVRYRVKKEGMEKETYIESERGIELKFKDKVTNEELWLSTGTFERVTKEGMSEWVVELEGEINEKEELEGKEFLNEFRVNLLNGERVLEVGEMIEGEIIVEGVLEGVYQNYINESSLEATFKYYDTHSESYKEHKEEVTGVEAILPLNPINEYIEVESYRELEGVEERGERVRGEYLEEKNGYYVKFGSLSESDIKKGEVSLNIASDFELKKVVIPKELIEIVEIEEIQIGGYKVEGEELKRRLGESEKVEILKEEWSSAATQVKLKIRNLVTQVNEEGYRGREIRLEGKVNQIGTDILLEGTFKTEYEDTSLNRTVTDSAVINAPYPTLYINTTAYNEQGCEDKKVEGEVGSLTGYRVRYGATDSRLWGSGTVSLKMPIWKDITMTRYGFFTEKVIIKKELLESSKITGITIFGEPNSNGVYNDYIHFNSSSLQGKLNARGDIELRRSDWASGISRGDVYLIEIRYGGQKKGEAKEGIVYKDEYIEIEGRTTTVGALDLTSAFDTNYPTKPSTLVHSKSDKGTLSIKEPEVMINVESYKETESGVEEVSKRVEGDIDKGTSGYYIRYGSRNNFGITQGKLLLKVPYDSRGLGYELEKLKISEGLLGISNIEKVRLYSKNRVDYKEVLIEGRERTEEGCIEIRKEEWCSEIQGGVVYEVELYFSNHKAEVGGVYERAYIKLEGTPRGEGELELEGEVSAIYPTKTIKEKDTSIVNIEKVKPVLELYATREIEGVEEKGSEVEISVNEERIGVEGYIYNTSRTSTGGKVTLTIPVEQGVKGLKGFILEELIIEEGYIKKGYIEKIKIKKLGELAETEYQKEEIESKTPEEGKIKFNLEEGVERIEIELGVLKGVEQTGAEVKEEDKLKIALKGVSREAYGVYSTEGKVESIYKGVSLREVVKTVSHAVIDAKGEVTVHMLPYYDKEETSTVTQLDDNYRVNTETVKSPVDGTIMKLGVPYEREYTYQFRISNPSVSKVLGFESNLVLDILPEGGTEGGRGFHTEKIKIKKNIYKILEGEEISIIGINGEEVTLIEEEGSVVIKKGENEIRRVSLEEDTEITKEELKNNGIIEVKQIKIEAEHLKENIVKETGSAKTIENAIEVTGFSDSKPGEFNEGVGSYRYKREEIGEAVKYPRYEDVGVVTISKMYFDTVINASYKEQGEVDRYTSSTVPKEHVREEGRGAKTYESSTSFDDDATLEIGYKALGSIGVDFRQYAVDSTNSNDFNNKYLYYDHEVSPKNISTVDKKAYTYPKDKNGGDVVGTEYSTIRKYAYNTEAKVEIEVDIPDEGFEAYYIKVDKRAKEGLKKIKIVKRDGTEEEIGVENWTENGVDKEGVRKDWRLNLLGEKVSYETEAITGGSTSYYKEPEAYEDPTNPVDKVIFYLEINKEEVDSEGRAKEPTFGTWYEDYPYSAGRLDMTNAWNQNMFEIVGRYYKEGNYTASASTRLEIGSKTEPRVEEGSKTNSKSTMSYTNRYVRNSYYSYYYNRWIKELREYTGRGIYSEVGVSVLSSVGIGVEKGVLGDVGTQKNVQAVYGELKDYVIDVKKGYITADGWGYDSNGNLVFSQETDRNLRMNNWNKVVGERSDAPVYGLKESVIDKVKVEESLPPLSYNEGLELYEGFKPTELVLRKESKEGVDRLKVYLTSGKEIEYSKEEIQKDKEDYVIEIVYTEASTTGGTVKERASKERIELEKGEYVKKVIYEKDKVRGVGLETSEYIEEGRSENFIGEEGVDIEIYGEVCAIRGVDETNEDTELNKLFEYRESTGRNRVVVLGSQENGSSRVEGGKDDAVLKARNVPIKAGYDIRELSTGVLDMSSPRDSQAELNNTVDYEAGLKGVPTESVYGVYVWNAGTNYFKAGVEEVDNEIKDAPLSRVSFTNNFPTGFRVREIKIRREAFEGDNWRTSVFEIEGQTGGYVNVLDKFELVGDYYVLDINKLYREGVLKLPTVGEEDYINLYVKSYRIKIDTKHPTEELKQMLPLGDVTDKRKYIVDKDTPIVEYRGNWVEKKKKGWDNEVWTDENNRSVLRSTDYIYHSEQKHSLTKVAIGSDTIGSVKVQGYEQEDDNYVTVLHNRVGVINLSQRIEEGEVQGYGYYESEGVKYPTNYDSLLPKDRVKVNVKLKAEDTVVYTTGYRTEASYVKNPVIRYEAPSGTEIKSWRYKEIDSGIGREKVEGKIETNQGVELLEEGVETNEKGVRVLEVEVKGDIELNKSYEIEVELEVQESSRYEKDDSLKAPDTTYSAVNRGVVKVCGGERNGGYAYNYTDNKERAITKIYNPNYPTTKDEYKVVGLGSSVDETQEWIGKANKGKEEGVYSREYKTDFRGDGELRKIGRIVSSIDFYEPREELVLSYKWLSAPEGSNVVLPVENIDKYKVELRVGNIWNETLHPLKEKEVMLNFKYTVNGKEVQSFYLDEWPAIEGLNERKVEGLEVYYMSEEGYSVTNPRWEKVLEGTKSPKEYTQEGNPIRAIKVVYKGVKEADENGKRLSLGEIVLKGEGRYIDERSEKAQKASETSTLYVDTRVYDNYEKEGVVYQTRKGESKDTSIRRSRPVVYIDNQTFNTEEGAKGTYVFDDTNIKETYRPGEEIWRKLVVINNYEDSTGLLEKPEIYEKIPEYLEYPELEEFEVVIKDKTGVVIESYNLKPTTNMTIDGGAKELKVLSVESEDIKGLDIGGNQVFEKIEGTKPSEIVDRKPTDTKTNPVEEINFRIYKISIGRSLERGESIEVYYRSRIKAVGELREGLSHPITKWKENGEEIPAYLPRLGEYTKYENVINSYTYDDYAQPLEITQNYPTTQTKGVPNEPMDMSNIYIETGVSGGLSYGVDRWEHLKDSEAVVPGSRRRVLEGRTLDTQVIEGDYGDIVFDTDIKTGEREIGKVIPILPTNVATTKGTVYDELSNGYTYQGVANESGEIVNSKVDMYKYLLSGRTKREDLGELVKDSENIIWTCSGMHLETSWLYTTSSIETETNDVKDMNGVSPSISREKSGINATDNGYSYPWLDEDQSIMALEYGEEFTTHLYGYNYGDWDLDGVEFIYTMPLGVEPILSTTGGTISEKIDVRGVYYGDIEGGVDISKLKSNLFNNGHTREGMELEEIPRELIEVEVLQSPEKNMGYKAPKEYQEGVYKKETKDYKGEYYKEGVPWVLKITVKSELGRWYNRRSKAENQETYRIRVSIPSRVYAETEEGMWYDEVYLKPYDKEKEAEIKNSDCYQIYSVDQWSGDVKTKAKRDIQGYGMNRGLKGSEYSYYSEFSIFSPNTEYVNGYNVQCSEVETEKYSGTQEKYAQGGTRAIKKVPIVRMWVDVTGRDSNNVLGKDKFYIQGGLKGEDIQVNIENRYVRSQNAEETNEKAHNDYRTNGGYGGSIIEPEIRIKLPEGIAPVDKEGVAIKLEEGEEKEIDVEELDWEIIKSKWTSRTKIEEQGEEEKDKFEIKLRRYYKNSFQKERGKYELIIKPKEKDYEKDFEEVVKVKKEELLQVRVGVISVETLKEGKELEVEVEVESKYQGEGLKTDEDVYNLGRADSYYGDGTTYVTRDYRVGSSHKMIRTYVSGGTYTYNRNGDYRLDAVREESTTQIPITYTGTIERDYTDESFIGSMEVYEVTGKGTDEGVKNTVKLKEVTSKLGVESNLVRETRAVDGEYTYGDTLWYDIEIENKERDEEGKKVADILHSKVVVTEYLPNPLKWEGGIELVLEDSQGVETVMSEEEAESLGWIIEAEKEEGKGVGEFLGYKKGTRVRIEVITPEDIGGLGQEELYKGKYPKGNLRAGEVIKIRLKTRVGELNTNEGIGEEIWEDGFKTYTYVELIERQGEYLNTGFDIEDKVAYENEVEESVLGVDINGDGDIVDKYTSTNTGDIGILNPKASVRVDSPIPNIKSYDPITEVVTFDYTKRKMLDELEMYVTQAKLEEGVVSEFIVQYDLPYKGTEKIKQEPKETDTDVSSKVKEISTGAWEVPEGYVNKDLLEERLKVYVYVKYREDGKYEEISEEGQEGWYLLNEGGSGLTENETIEVPTETIPYIRQIRWVIKDELGELLIPKGFRLDIDANEEEEGKQELDEIDGERMNLKALSEGVKENSIRLKLEDSWGYMETASLKYAEHKVSVVCKYDDTQYSKGIGEHSAGYVATPENPSMGVSMELMYLKGELMNIGTDENPEYITDYKWDDRLMVSANSSLLKQKLRLTNVPEEISNHPKDVLTNPSLVLALPRIIKKPEGKLKYIEYKDITKEHILHEDYMNLKYYGKNQDMYWTWYVVNEKGEVVENPELKLNKEPEVYKTKIDYTQDKTAIKWEFEGKLYPGQTVIVTTLLEIDENLGGTVKEEDVRFRVYGLKESTFTPYILEGGENEVVLVTDTVDIDKDNEQYEQVLMLKNDKLRFESYDNFIRTKRVYTDDDTTGSILEKPSSVGEGRRFRYEIRSQNTAALSNGYKLPSFFDMLPEEGDTYIRGVYNADRELVPLDRGTSIKAKLDTSSFKVIENKGGNEREVDRSEYDIWVGPAVKNEKGEIEIVREGYPSLESRTKDYFFADMENVPRSDKSKREKELEDYFVKLEDWDKYIESIPTEREREEKERELGMFYITFKDKGGVFEGSSAYTVSYEMEIPLNAGVGSVEGIEGYNSYEETSVWNTFMVWAMKSGMPPAESNKAGVYVDAPIGRGYIGDYVWEDINGDNKKNEAEYGKIEEWDVREIKIKNTLDINGDGVVDEKDDPGINGVKVELLTEKGYVSDREGVATIEVGEGRYRAINEETGGYLERNGLAIMSGKPEITETKFDYYMNEGYYIISNIKPGKYKLRFTFPEEYNKGYIPSSEEINGTAIKVYKKGERLPDLPGDIGAIGDNTEVESLTIETGVFEVKAVEETTKAKDHDSQATGCDIGVTRPVSYGGEVWLDRELMPTQSSGSTTSGSITSGSITSGSTASINLREVTNRPYSTKNSTGNGRLDKGEALLEGIKVKLYEVSEEGIIEEAIGVDGKPIEAITDTYGRYQFDTIRPERNYYIAIEELPKDCLYLESPTYEKEVLLEDNDNNLMRIGGKLRTEIFKAKIPRDEKGCFKYENEEEGKYQENTSIDLGLIDEVGTIGNKVWLDTNKNGLQDEGEKGLEGYKLILESYYVDGEGVLQRTDDPDKEVITDENGEYMFTGLSSYYEKEDNLYLKVFKLRLAYFDKRIYSFTKANVGNIESLDSDMQEDSMYVHGGEGYIIIAKEITEETEGSMVREYKGKKYDITKRVSDYTNDIGLKSYGIEGLVWSDKNKDGIRQEEEERLEGVRVEVYRELLPTIEDSIGGSTTEGTIGGSTTEGTIGGSTTESTIGGEEQEGEGLLVGLFKMLTRVVEGVLDLIDLVIEEFEGIEEEEIEVEGEYEYVGEVYTDEEGKYIFEELPAFEISTTTSDYITEKYVVRVETDKDRKVTKYQEGKEREKDNDYRKVVIEEGKEVEGLPANSLITDSMELADIESIDSLGVPKYEGKKYIDLGVIERKDTTTTIIPEEEPEQPKPEEEPEEEPELEQPTNPEQPKPGLPNVTPGVVVGGEYINPPVLIKPSLPPILVKPSEPPVIVKPSIPSILIKPSEPPILVKPSEPPVLIKPSEPPKVTEPPLKIESSESPTEGNKSPIEGGESIATSDSTLSYVYILGVSLLAVGFIEKRLGVLQQIKSKKKSS